MTASYALNAYLTFPFIRRAQLARTVRARAA